MKSKNKIEQEALFNQIEESILNKKIDLSNFFKALAKEIVRKQYDYGVDKHLNAPKSKCQLNIEFNNFVLAEMQKLWESSPTQTIKWEDIKVFLERNNLIDKIYDYNIRIYDAIQDLRESFFESIYGTPYYLTQEYRDVYKLYPEGIYHTYVHPDGREENRKRNIYLGKVTKALESQLIDVENAINNGTPAGEITISKSDFPGEKPRLDDLLTEWIRFLIDLTRKNNQGEAFREVFTDSSETRQKLGSGDIEIKPYEQPILQMFGENLVKANIEIVKEKAKLIPAKDLLPDPELERAMEKYLIDRAKPFEIPFEEKAFNAVANTVKEVYNFAQSLGSWWNGDDQSYAQNMESDQRETEREKKINSSSGTKTNRLGKVRKFIYNNATIAFAITGGISLAAIGCYTGGLTLLPLIGLTYSTTYYTIAAESIMGLFSGSVIGKLASYLSSTVEEIETKDTTSNITKTQINYSTAHAKDEKKRQLLPSAVSRT